jgi:hypothetical protein
MITKMNVMHGFVRQIHLSGWMNRFNSGMVIFIFIGNVTHTDTKTTDVEDFKFPEEMLPTSRETV